MAGLGAVFAFGPDNGFFFEYQGTRRWYNIPADLERILTSEGAGGVKKVFCLCLREKGGYLITYANGHGEVECHYAKIPHGLLGWLKEGVEDGFLRGGTLQYQHLQVAFGPEESYFASARCEGGIQYYRWKAVNDRVEKSIQMMVAGSDPEDIWSVCFGALNSLLIYLQKHSQRTEPYWKSYLSSRYSVLLDCIREAPDENIAGYYIVMDQFCNNQFFMLRPDGTAEWQVNSAHADKVDELGRIILQGQSVRGSTTSLLQRGRGSTKLTERPKGSGSAPETEAVAEKPRVSTNYETGVV